MTSPPRVGSLPRCGCWKVTSCWYWAAIAACVSIVSAEFKPLRCGAAQFCTELRDGERLLPGEWLSSPNGMYVAPLDGSRLQVVLAADGSARSAHVSGPDLTMVTISEGKLQLWTGNNASQLHWQSSLPDSTWRLSSASAFSVVAGQAGVDRQSADGSWAAVHVEGVDATGATVRPAKPKSTQAWSKHVAYSSGLLRKRSQIGSSGRLFLSDDGFLNVASLERGLLWQSRQGAPAETAVKAMQFYRFTPLRTRSGTTTNQLSELMFRKGGTVLDFAGAEAYPSPGSQSPQGETADKAIDSDKNTKWLDNSMGGMVVKFPNPVDATDFSFKTANDVQDRDPVQWRLEGSSDNQHWFVLNDQSSGDFATPEERFASTPWFSLSALRQVRAADVDVPSVAPNSAEVAAVEQEANHQKKMKDCRAQVSCSGCNGAGCAWCLGGRKCVVDIAWICQGDVDHVSPPGGAVGKASCPSKAAVEEAHSRSRKRAEAAAAAAVEEEEDSTCGSDGGKGCDSSKGGDSEEPEASGSEEAARPKDEIDPELLRELKRRLRLAEEEKGTQPYKVLSIDKQASPSQVRKAYRKLSIKFHPDKWTRAPAELCAKAEKVFADIAQAYETIGNPDKRTAFDNFQGGGEDFGEHWQKQWQGNEDFYFGDPLISTLTEEVWERRLVGDSIWLVKFYAAWCPASRNVNDVWRELSKAVEDFGVELGAVNCVSNKNLCATLSIGSYPTIMILNRKYGTMQEYSMKKNGGLVVDKVKEWTRNVALEWRWLFRNSNVRWDLTEESFRAGGALADSEAMWIVSFMDGRECGPCRALCTNLLRLSASLRGLPVEIAGVDCSLPDNEHLCYRQQEIPEAPHAPVTKAWRSGAKNLSEALEVGEMLFAPQDFEPREALRLVERAVRLALSDRQAAGALAEAAASDSDFEQNPEDEKEDEPPGDDGSGGGGFKPSAWDGPSIAWGEGREDGGRRKGLPKPWMTHGGSQGPQLGR